MSSFDYASCIKIRGDPILPPVILPADRPQLQKYKEAAIEKEKEIKERALSLRNSLAREMSVGLSDDETGESSTSQTSVKTAQVMWFIRQALKNVGVNAEEVKSLQSQIFQELNDIQKSNSCDTLHNFEDSSVFASTSAEASPEKPDRLNEKLQQFQNEESFRDDSSFGPSERSISLPLPPSPAEKSSAVIVPSPVTPTKQSQITTSPVEETTPRLIRRNSYTLSSPSPGVLSYFKSMAKASENRASLSVTSLSSVKRNLNDVWSTPDASLLDDNAQVFALDNHSKIIETGGLDTTNEMFQTKTGNANQMVRKAIWEKTDVSLSKKELAAAKIQAGVRGYLTRRLLRTARVMELKNSIKDSLITALELFTDPEVKDKNELEFRKHLTLQVEKLCDEWHSVIIDSTPQERMKIIRLDRHKIERQKLAKSVPKKLAPKKSSHVNDSKPHSSRPMALSLHARTLSDPKAKRLTSTSDALSKSMPPNYKPRSCLDPFRVPM